MHLYHIYTYIIYTYVYIHHIIFISYIIHLSISYTYIIWHNMYVSIYSATNGGSCGTAGFVRCPGLGYDLYIPQCGKELGSDYKIIKMVIAESHFSWSCRLLFA